MSSSRCEPFEDCLPEMALGVLEGRERAEVLAHLQLCPACQQELLALSAVADRLIELTPLAEPPAGFETRVLSALMPQVSVQKRRRRSWSTTARLSAVAAGAVVVAVSGWAIGHGGLGNTALASEGGANLRTASFLAGGRTLGRVVAFDGADAWIAMSVNGSLGDGNVRCEILERDGKTTSVGTFSLTYGTGYWGAPLAVAPSSVKGVELVDFAGKTVATALFQQHDQ